MSDEGLYDFREQVVKQDGDRKEVSATGDQVDHPLHYGGAADAYEAIKVIEAWGLGFCLGNALKYICRAGRKYGADTITDLEKAAWYLSREIEQRKKWRAT